MVLKNLLKNVIFVTLLPIFISSCAKFNSVDARKFPPEPDKRVQKNMEEGRGFRLMDKVNNKGTTYEFASSNELWRASLDTIDFIPLTSVNYSGGIIITDWYSSDQNSNDFIKISIRFLTNEIRSDALKIKIFKKNCTDFSNCKVSESNGELKQELRKKILKTAKIYESQNKDESRKSYSVQKLKK